MVSIKTGGSQYPIPPGSSNLRIVIKPPFDVAVMTAADRVAEFVKADGWALEQLILEREMSNPMFAFLHETQSPDHAYYRWRAYSLAQGDTLEKFRTKPFRMYENGPIWQPPECPIKVPEGLESSSRVFSERTAEQAAAAAAASSASTVAETGDSQRSSTASTALSRPRSSSEGERRIRERARERDSDGRARILDGQLSNRQLDDLHEMLRALKVERKSIEEGMMFCLDHSEAADEVIDALVESLTLSAADSHVEKKMARLYLLSDILHNSSAPYPKTARFRSQIEAKLPEILASFREAIQSMGRISAEHMR
jgi:U2-associated protein SR140